MNLIETTVVIHEAFAAIDVLAFLYVAAVAVFALGKSCTNFTCILKEALE